MFYRTYITYFLVTNEYFLLLRKIVTYEYFILAGKIVTYEYFLLLMKINKSILGFSLLEIVDQDEHMY